MIESIQRNPIVAILFTMAISGLLWYPDFAGLSHTRLSFWLPCTGMEYGGSMFDTVGYKLATIAMATVNGLFLCALSARFLSLGRASAIVPLCYLLVVFSYPQAHAFSPAFPAALLGIMGLFALFISGGAKKPVSSLFISALLVGCAGLLYLPSLVMAVGFVAMAITLNIFSGRNILVFLGGLLLSFGGCLLCRYLFWGDLIDYTNLLVLGGYVHPLHIQMTPSTVFLTLVYLYLLLKALARWYRRAYGNQTYKYKILTSFMWMFVVCGAPALLYVHKAYSYLPVLSVPVSVLLAYYYSEERISKQMKAEFIVLMLAVALNQVAYVM